MTHTKVTATQKGFTLIEILVVIGLIAILAAIVLIAINPARQFAQARNAQRQSNVLTVMNAIGQRLADNKGIFAGTAPSGAASSTCPTLTTAAPYYVSAGTAGAQGGLNLQPIDLSCLVGPYIPSSLPFDPDTGTSTNPKPNWTSATNYFTGYTVAVDTSGRYTVYSPGAELGTIISVTR